MENEYTKLVVSINRDWVFWCDEELCKATIGKTLYSLVERDGKRAGAKMECVIVKEGEDLPI